MKKLILILTFISGFAFGQSNIDGLGKFKVGKTTIKIIDSLTQNGFPIVKCNDLYYLCIIENYSKKVLIEPVGELNKKFNLLENKKVFIINNYKIADIEIKSLKILFYNGLLYSIETEEINPKLYSALRDKYKYNVNTVSKEVNCSSVFGNFSKVEENNTIIYRDDDISAKEIDNRFYNSKCEEDGIYNLSINYQPIYKNVFELEKPLITEFKNKIEKEKSEKLKDL